MRIDPSQHGWMTAPETVQVMAAPVTRNGQGWSVQSDVGGCGRWRVTIIKDRGHEN